MGHGIGINRVEFDEDDYPRDLSYYTPTDHFVNKMKDDRRMLETEIVEEAVENGELCDNGDGTACFKTRVGEGVGYYVICGWHEKGYRVLITAWPHLHDREAALDSGLWSTLDLNKIAELNAEYYERS